MSNKLSKASEKTIERLLALPAKERNYWKLEPKPGFMPLVIERLYTTDLGTVYSFAHYGELNGDAMRDPDVELLHTKTGWIPLTYRNDYLGAFNTAAWIADGKLFGKPAEIKDLVSFVNIWMKNITETFLN